MKPISIVYVTCVFPPYKGGIGNVCYEQSKRIKERGYDISVLTPRYTYKETQKLEIPVHYLSSFLSYGNASVLFQLGKYLKEADIIHFHYPFLGSDVILFFTHLFRKIVLKKKTKLIVHYHMDLIAPNFFYRIFFSFTQWVVLPLLFLICDAIIVTSMDYVTHSQIKKYIRKYHDKTHVVPNGVDTKRFYPLEKKEMYMKQYQLNSDDFIVLFVGGLDEAHFFKGVHVLIDAISLLPSDILEKTKVCIVGEGNLRKKYEEMAKEKNIASNVIFTGSVDNETLPHMYQMADIFVLPSITSSEAFGMVLVEAFACQKPVITSNLPGVRSVVDENVNGILVQSNNAKALKDALLFSFNNPILMQSYAKNGFEKVQINYDWEIVTDRLEQVYKQIL